MRSRKSLLLIQQDIHLNKLRTSFCLAKSRLQLHGTVDSRIPRVSSTTRATKVACRFPSTCSCNHVSTRVVDPSRSSKPCSVHMYTWLDYERSLAAPAPQGRSYREAHATRPMLPTSAAMPKRDTWMRRSNAYWLPIGRGFKYCLQKRPGRAPNLLLRPGP